MPRINRPIIRNSGETNDFEKYSKSAPKTFTIPFAISAFLLPKDSANILKIINQSKF